MHVDSGKGLVEVEHAEGNHQHGANERTCRPIDVQSGNLAQADEDVGDNEDDERGDHGRHFTMDGRVNSSIVQNLGRYIEHEICAALAGEHNDINELCCFHHSIKLMSSTLQLLRDYRTSIKK